MESPSTLIIASRLVYVSERNPKDFLVSGIPAKIQAEVGEPQPFATASHDQNPHKSPVCKIPLIIIFFSSWGWSWEIRWPYHQFNHMSFQVFFHGYYYIFTPALSHMNLRSTPFLELDLENLVMPGRIRPNYPAPVVMSQSLSLPLSLPIDTRPSLPSCEGVPGRPSIALLLSLDEIVCIVIFLNLFFFQVWFFAIIFNNLSHQVDTFLLHGS